MNYVWDDVLTDRDRATVEKDGYGRSRGFEAKPCVMIIDAQYNYVKGS